MGFFSKITGGLFGGSSGGGKAGARELEGLSKASADRLFKRLDESRTRQKGDFANALSQIQQFQNPELEGLTSLEGEFRSRAAGAAGQSGIAGVIGARMAGGGRGNAFSFGAADIGQRGLVQAGFQQAALQQQATANIAGLRQFRAQLGEQDFARQMAMISQQQQVLGTLEQTALAGQSGQSVAALGGAGQALSAGINNSFSANLNRGIGNLVGSAGKLFGF